MQISVGSSHASAVSKGGDCYVWGYGKCGALGLGNFKNQKIPAVVTGFGDTDQIKYVSCGENHTCALTMKGEVYAWGHVSDGRLGLGARERVGVPEDEKIFFPGPSLLTGLQSEFVTQVSCGTQHVLAITLTQIFSWGSGAGGRLGHNDYKEVRTNENEEAWRGAKQRVNKSRYAWRRSVFSPLHSRTTNCRPPNATLTTTPTNAEVETRADYSSFWVARDERERRYVAQCGDRAGATVEGGWMGVYLGQWFPRPVGTGRRDGIAESEFST